MFLQQKKQKKREEYGRFMQWADRMYADNHGVVQPNA